jgi:hypothetical protein
MEKVLPACVHRFWLRKKLNQKTTANTFDHPAVDCVKNYLSGHEECLILWGLSESNTLLCAQIIANGVIQEKGFAMVIRCDAVAGSLRVHFLNAVGCKTLDSFVKYVPKNTWLIFDAVVFGHPDTEVFLKYMIQLSRDSAKFKLLLCVHSAKNAMLLLQWANHQRHIVLIEPADCCRWRAVNVRSSMSQQMVKDIMQSGCPSIQTDADELTARWENGTERLTRFIDSEWSPAGVFCC